MLYSETRPVVVYAHPFSLNKSMVSMFCMFVQDWSKKKRPMLPQEMRGTHSQKSNFATMRHLGIIDSLPGKNEGWFPTEKGLQFFAAKIPLTMPVFHLQEETLPEDHPAYAMPFCKKRVTKYIYDIDAVAYRQVQDWQRIMSESEPFSEPF